MSLELVYGIPRQDRKEAIVARDEWDFVRTGGQVPCHDYRLQAGLKCEVRWVYLWALPKLSIHTYLPTSVAGKNLNSPKATTRITDCSSFSIPVYLVEARFHLELLLLFIFSPSSLSLLQVRRAANTDLYSRKTDTPLFSSRASPSAPNSRLSRAGAPRQC